MQHKPEDPGKPLDGLASAKTGTPPGAGWEGPAPRPEPVLCMHCAVGDLTGPGRIERARAATATLAVHPRPGAESG